MGATKSIGPYDILRLLDAGGMGKVYLAREREGVAAGRLVVVKTIRTELERSPEHVASFQREARVLAHLRHPNVVQLYDAGRAGHRLYMAMEYLEGFDLSKVLRVMSEHGRRMPLEVILHVGREVALALDAAHAWRGPDGPSGLVHRDLSPHNVFLLFGGGVKLLDFGLARTYGEISTTRTGMVKGKFRYLAPEQARGEELDARVDLFTLGLVLHEMITGKRAYDQQGDVDILRAAMAGEFTRLGESMPDAPSAVKIAIERAVSPDREERHPTALALAEDLRHAADQAGIGGDSLALRRFMEEVRVLAETTRSVSEAPSEDDLSGEGEYLGASQIASVADVVPSRRPPPPTTRKQQRRTWAAAALAAIGVLSLLGALAVSRRASGPPSASAPATPPTVAPADSVAVVLAPAASASADPEVPTPAAVASAAAAPSAPSVDASPAVRAPGVATSAGNPKSKDRHVVKPKRGVGTGVVADYP